MKPTLIIQNCPAESPGTILDYHHDRNRPYVIVHTHRGERVPDIAGVGAVICLGCPHSAARYQEQPFLVNLLASIREISRRDRPYLGICFGGQILAVALGARVTANPVKEIGRYEVGLTPTGRQDRLFRGFDPTFPVFHWHADTFSVPAGARLLAEGQACRNQAFGYGRMYGLQFHLEVDLDEIGRWCSAYRNELAEFGKTASDITADFQPWADTVRRLSYRLLDNFLAI